MKLYDDLKTRTADDPAALAVLELHRPQPPTITVAGDDERVCKADGADGYDWDYPEWPCATIIVIAEQYGVMVND